MPRHGCIRHYLAQGSAEKKKHWRSSNGSGMVTGVGAKYARLVIAVEIWFHNGARRRGIQTPYSFIIPAWCSTGFILGDDDTILSIL